MEERFNEFIKNYKTQGFLAFSCYFLCVLYCKDNLPSIMQCICTIAFTVTYLCCLGYIFNYDGIKDFKTIGKELLMFIPVFLLSTFMTSLLISGEPANQTSVNEILSQSPILYSIIIVIIGPMLEEYIFRFLPSKFIKNQLLYVLISSIIFAGMHVINDPNPFYYIWYYLPLSLYFGYRYYKTENLFVTISMHSFNNLIATLALLIF